MYKNTYYPEQMKLFSWIFFS